MNICSTPCQVLSPEDFENIMWVTDTPKDQTSFERKVSTTEK